MSTYNQAPKTPPPPAVSTGAAWSHLRRAQGLCCLQDRAAGWQGLPLCHTGTQFLSCMPGLLLWTCTSPVRPSAPARSSSHSRVSRSTDCPCDGPTWCIVVCKCACPRGVSFPKSPPAWHQARTLSPPTSPLQSLQIPPFVLPIILLSSRWPGYPGACLQGNQCQKDSMTLVNAQ